MIFKSAVVLVLLTGVVALTGCSDDRPVTYKPGVYKGNKDDLLQKSGPAMTEKLRERFRMVQTDR
jgi:hypothetical protein